MDTPPKVHVMILTSFELHFMVVSVSQLILTVQLSTEWLSTQPKVWLAISFRLAFINPRFNTLGRVEQYVFLRDREGSKAHLAENAWVQYRDHLAENAWVKCRDHLAENA